METNFFQQLTAVANQPNAEWLLVVKQSGGGKIVVSVLYKDNACGDPASKIIPPLTFEQTPLAIDNSFFADLNSVMPETVQACNSMEFYLKQQETAKKQSIGTKGKTASEDRVKTDREKKYEARMKQADEMEAAGKFRDAWVKVPEIDDYPEKEAEIRKRRSELSAQFEPDLFNIKIEEPC